MLGHMSYRYKVPLVMVFTIIFTGLIVTVIMTWRTVEDLRNELFHNAIKVSTVINDTLVSASKQDNVWQAYQTLKTASAQDDGLDERVFIMLNSDNTVYASDHPKLFPLNSELRSVNAELARLEAHLLDVNSLEPYAYEHPNNLRIYVVSPIIDDGVALGTLIVGYSRSILLPRFYAIVKRVIFALLAVMLVLVPLGAYMGKRMAKPLTKLAHCLGRVGKEPPGKISCSLHEGDDEVGQLGINFRNMIKELAEKENLEKKMVESERLAAVGRLAAGVAHEINNPLGGMLNTINTFKHHGSRNDISDSTMSLLERGLCQIRETVSALLVEARVEGHPLTPQDVDDIYTLIQPDAQQRTIKVEWQNNLHETVALPSTQTRQILINLSMNAVQASEEGGNVWCSINREHNDLRINIENDSGQIDDNRISNLFEPHVHDNPNGHGLGLWVTYQLVRQLDGKIDVKNDTGRTIFSVSLPLERAA